MSARVRPHGPLQRHRHSAATISMLFAQAEQAATHLFDAENLSTGGRPGGPATWLPAPRAGDAPEVMPTATRR